MSDETKQGGGWAVAYREKATGQGFFHDDAHDVDERTARKVFGRCIRAGELGLKVERREIDAVRLLKADVGMVINWISRQEHHVGAIARWKLWREEDGQAAPYHDETMPLGVPCIPGAWGGDGCAMHSGFDLDENGLCIEGRRAAKVLDLIVVPRAMQDRHGLPATVTREEVEELHAFAVAELVHRGKGEGITDEQLVRAVDTFERRAAAKGGMNEEPPREGQEVEKR